MNQDAFEANLAIINALGLDPHNIRRNGLTIQLTDAGPIATIEIFLRNSEGKLYAINDEVATTLERYKLVPLEDESERPRPDPLPRPRPHRNPSTDI
jgi:hypothetical protein